MPQDRSVSDGAGVCLRIIASLIWALTALASFAAVQAAETKPPATMAVPDPKPEIRRLHLKHHWTAETLDVVYRIGDQYQPEAMAEINHFMRDWRCNKTIVMDPKLIDRLYEIQQSVGEHYTIRLISGYRSEGYNASLLAAGHSVDPSSQHMLGRAADIFVLGLPPKRLRDAAEDQGAGGVGYYPFSGPRFVHVDTGPDRHWTEIDPAVRRRLGFIRRQHRRFRLDCSLTIAKVLEEIPPMDALSALPPGAASNPAATLRQAAFTEMGEGWASTGALASPARAEGDRGVCDGGNKPPDLDVMTKIEEWRGAGPDVVHRP